MTRRVILVATLALGVAAPAAHATPPGTNGLLLWQTEARDAPPDLWAGNPDGTGARELVASPRHGELEGAFSPVSATQFAFVRGGLRGFPLEIYAGDLQTGQVRRLTRNRAYTDAPAFSPDGQRIAFHTDRDFPPPEDEESPPPTEIYVMDADGSDQRRLTRDRRFSLDPDWSPDGRSIVFSEGRTRGDRQEWRIVRMRADGRARRALTRFSRRLTVNPKWTPDGRILVEVERARTRSDIVVMNADGSGRRTLLGTRAWETNPVPSPDGTRIVFTSDRDRPGRDRLGPGTEVYTMAVDGTDVVRITDNRVPDRFPDWQRLP